MTPYQKHEQLGHTMTCHSPNGIDLIEECPVCGARFLHNPSFGYPVSLDYMPVDPVAQREWFRRRTATR